MQISDSFDSASCTQLTTVLSIKQLSSSSYLFNIEYANSLQSRMLNLRVSRLNTRSQTAYPIIPLLSVIR